MRPTFVPRPTVRPGSRSEGRSRPRIPFPPPVPVPSAEGYVEVEGGSLYFRSLGSPAAPAVLVVHGGPSDHRYLAPLADLVPAGFRVVWYDQLGCGRSAHPRSFRGYSIEAAGNHTEQVRRELGLDRPHLFGHSWGGALALQAAVLAPQSFRSLAVCGGFGSEASFQDAMRRHVHSLPPALRDPIERFEREGRFRTPRYLAAVRERRRRYSTGLRAVPPEFAASLAAVNRRLLRAVYGDRPGLLSPARGYLESWDLSDDLRRLTMPTLLMSGGIEAGRYTARDLHRWIPGSRIVTFAGAAHLPFYQQRDRFVRTLARFFRVAGSRRRAPGSTNGRR